MITIKKEHTYPQEGFQDEFLSSNADIIIGGGAAGAGKTFVSLLAPVEHYDNPLFAAVYFRRTYSQIKNIGGLWDQSKKIYPKIKGKPNETDLHWSFPSGSLVKFSHLQHEKDIHNHQGAEYPMIIFDELTHFTEGMFWYLLSRNRSTCGVIPRVLATCNPDPDSFVARLIEWFIDQETGFPIRERSGKLRYFIRWNNAMVWGDTKAEVIEKAGDVLDSFPKSVKPEDLVKSITFITGSIYENKELLDINPGYLANLLSQDEATRSRLLDGNWKIRQDNSSLFQFDKINDVFTNHVAITKGRYITCDAARFGRDFCVIMVWQGWHVIAISVMKKTDVHDIVREIERLRIKFLVQKSNCVVDQDGVGSDTVSKGAYKGFSGGAQPKKIKGLKENYKNLKTQCYFGLAEHVNWGDIKVDVDNGSCCVDGVYTSKIKIGAKIVDIRDLIREDLRSIKNMNLNDDGKFEINSKDEQKVILGRSPDFGDTMMMRYFIDIRGEVGYLKG